MKYTITLLLIITLLWSCDQQNKEIATLSGQVNVNWSKKVKLHSGSISLAEEWSGFVDHRDTTITVDDEGKFNFIVDLTEPGFFSLSHEGSKVNLYVEPGDSLNIDLTQGTRFSGSNGIANQHYSSMLDIIDQIESSIVDIQSEFFILDTKAYDSKLDSISDMYFKAHEDYKTSNDVPAVLDKRIQDEIAYRDKFYRIIHPAIYNMYIVEEELGIDEDYFSNIAEGELSDPSLLSSPNFVLFLDRLVDIYAAGDLKTGNYFDAGIQKIHPRFEAIQNLQAHPKIKEYLYTEHLMKSMSNYGISYFGDMMDQFSQEVKDEQLKNQVLTMYESKLEKRAEADTILTYKRIGDIALEAHVFFPENKDSDKSAYAFFHGGGWAAGIPEWGYTNCQRYSEKGMVAISFEYRLLDIHSSNIINCLEDVNSAIIWIREQAGFLGIDPEQIVAAGFSAGGHLAAGTAILDEYNLTNDSGFNSIPNAIVVHSATYNTTKSAFFRRQANGNAMSISNHHNVKANLVPGIFFHGTRDHLAPINEFTEFRDRMDSLNNDYEYKIFEGVGHFFGNPQASEEVKVLTDQFLTERGFIADN